MDYREHLEWARRYSRCLTPSGILSYGDFEAIAEAAVWRAAGRYDGREGVAFRTYAKRLIRGAILQAQRDTSGVTAYAWERGVRFPPVCSLDAILEAGEDDDKALCPAVEEADVAEALSVRVALTHLPRRTRAVVWGVAAEGRTRTEMSEVLGISTSLTSRLYTQAVGLLRDELS